MRNLTKLNEKEIIREIENNKIEQLAIGHHGVPLTVYKNNFFLVKIDLIT